MSRPTCPRSRRRSPDEISTATDSVLWFEALFNAKASSVSSTNAALLVTGQMSPEEFMTVVQDALDQG